jgi:acetyltransferase-like isoleucine patch superfamily enzyme
MRKGFGRVGKDFYLEYPAQIAGAEHIFIGSNFSAFSRLRLEAYSKHNGHQFKPQIIIGDNFSANFDCHIGCANEIIIGNNVLLASKIFITDHFHGTSDLAALKNAPNDRKLFSKGPVVIEDNVWIGEGVAIMPNVRIGKNSIIGANAVVTKSFPENSLIVGNPAKNIRQ